ncbi:MAG: ABC transporter permease [Actinobacteria bacterium]|nr:ABC transporter permease [Actinomycetota bacterium]
MGSSTAYLLRRLAQAPFVLVVVTLTIFALIHVTPGDPIQIMLGMETSPEAVEALRRQYNFDRPLHEQYVIWVANAIRGDLGSSIRQHQPVTQMIAQRFPISLQLATAAMLFAMLIALPAGIFSAIRRNTWLDYVLTGLSIGGLSIPNFALALLLVFVFAMKFGWFPITGIGASTSGESTLWGAIAPFVLPAVALGTQQTAILARLLRSSMLDVLTQDYIRTAYAKGLSSRAVILRNAVRNALIPVVTYIGLDLGAMVGGTILTETVFNWPGVGLTIFQAINLRDWPIVMGGVVIIVFLVMLINLVVDISYAFLDPRIRYGKVAA